MLRFSALLFMSLQPFTLLFSQSVVNTLHNLSAGGPGSVKASSESQVCIFCHTPHNSSPKAPLWNRPDPGGNYTLYSSSTAEASPGQPTGSSLLCLSCHDGTIALGNVLSRNNTIGFQSGVTTMPTGTTNLTTDLSDDHPLSFTYSSALAAADGELADPASLTGPVKLENGKMQCTSCHDPHENVLGDFLVASTRDSELCLHCHDKAFWSTAAAHRISNAGWDVSGNDPWFHTPYTTVSENACENCHNPHNAGGSERLMNFQAEEDNCLICHDGSVASTDIKALLTRPEIHDVFAYSSSHDPYEANVVSTRHVECQDCHNPHASRNSTANAPAANGFLLGVKGVDTDGNAVTTIQYEYELCYRCHADSPDKPGSPTGRQIEQSNVRLEFDLTNPSFHPIEGPGKNGNVPSLISPLTESSIIFCTDCHASNGSGAPSGPHGSIYPQILKYNYSTIDGKSVYNPFDFELCFQCHSETVIFNNDDVGRDVHEQHLKENTESGLTTCNVCHDPHGVSSSQGSPTANSHLINFDLSVVSSNEDGQLRFEDTGLFEGECYLSCHGEDHDRAHYKN